MGLALGKTLSEVRALPYPEFRKWWLFYLLEPWGFELNEYHNAALRAEVHNTKITKRSQVKSPKHFMRNMIKEISNFIATQRRRIEAQNVDLTSDEGKELASERVIQAFEAMFGSRIVRKDK